MLFYLTQRNAIKGVNIERHRRRNNTFASQFWSLASGTKELLSRSPRIYCIPSRAILSRGSFRSASRMERLAKYGGGTLIHLRKPVSNAVSERGHCHGSRAFFMFAFLKNNAPRPRPMLVRGACPVENSGSTLNMRGKRWPYNASVPQ